MHFVLILQCWGKRFRGKTPWVHADKHTSEVCNATNLSTAPQTICTIHACVHCTAN